MAISLGNRCKFCELPPKSYFVPLARTNLEVRYYDGRRIWSLSNSNGYYDVPDHDYVTQFWLDNPANAVYPILSLTDADLIAVGRVRHLIGDTESARRRLGIR